MKFGVDDGVLMDVYLNIDETEVIIPDNVIAIAEGVFYKCEEINKVVVGNNVVSIGNCCFRDCYMLDDICFGESVESLEGASFFACKSLEKIKLPDKLNYIGEEAFGRCYGLKEIVIPEGVTSIYFGTFEECANLERIVLPSKLKYIGEEAFKGCKSLRKISVPKSVEVIDGNVFDGCDNLEILEINNLKHLTFDCIEKVVENMNYVYFDKDNEKLIFSKYIKEGLEQFEFNDIDGCGRVVSCYLLLNYGEEFVDNFREMKYILNYLIKDKYVFNGEFRKEIFNCDKFNNLLKQLNKKYLKDVSKGDVRYYDIFKLAYSLGAFDNEERVRQSACEFISNLFEQGFLDSNNVHGSFESIDLRGYDKEWSIFLMDKENKKKSLKELLEYEENHSGYISRIYNDFEGIREFCRSNKGDQHYRRVTLDRCKEYLSSVKFAGINSRVKDIADEISRFTRNQSSFNDAKEIREEYLKRGIKNHILDEELVEKNVFDFIDEKRLEVLENLGDILGLLNELSNKKFTYEYLSKYDSKNFVLGKYCSCCSHLEGVGYGIMKASILHPDCQNLVIRDEKGNIIAKSTLYVNREQGYGVFNNVEIDNRIKDLKTKELIFKKYVMAIYEFVNKYNEKNADNPILQVNVGANLNDLEEVLSKYCVKSYDILEGIHFSNYGKDSKRYDGDWKKDGQYILYKGDEERKIK